MNLSPMRYKNYVWPHNPRVYEMSFKKDIAAHRIPFGLYTLQYMGRQHRVLKGEGEFSGSGAYAQFKRLAAVFFDNEPGVLVHPLWDATTAYFAALWLRQEPTENYVSYGFEFWECCEGYQTSFRQLNQVKEASAKKSGGSTEKKYYTAVYGDCLWKIANDNALSLNELLELNPQVKNPNILYVGDVIRIV